MAWNATRFLPGFGKWWGDRCLPCAWVRTRPWFGRFADGIEGFATYPPPFLRRGCQGCFPKDIKSASLVCVGGRRPATVGVVALGHGAGGGALPVHPPTFFGVLPFPFLSRTVDSTYADFARVAPAVSAATVVGPVVVRSRSRVRLTFRGRPSPGCICLDWGGCGGLVLGPVSVETPNCGGGEIGKVSVELEDSLVSAYQFEYFN